MSNPAEESPESGDASGREPVPGVDFDPYRFGRPEHPISPEFAPPGYTPPPGSSPYGRPSANPPVPDRQLAEQSPYGQHPYGQNPYGQHPYGQPPYGQPPYGENPYGQHPYGQPPSGPYGPPGPPPRWAPPDRSGYETRTPGRGKATAALVLGAASIVFCWLSFFDVVFVALAVIFGWLALAETRERPGRATPGGRGRTRGLAVTGLVLAVIGAVIAAVLSIGVVKALRDCDAASQTNSSELRQCLQDRYRRLPSPTVADRRRSAAAVVAGEEQHE